MTTKRYFLEKGCGFLEVGEDEFWVFRSNAHSWAIYDCQTGKFDLYAECLSVKDFVHLFKMMTTPLVDEVVSSISS